MFTFLELNDLVDTALIKINKLRCISSHRKSPGDIMYNWINKAHSYSYSDTYSTITSCKIPQVLPLPLDLSTGLGFKYLLSLSRIFLYLALPTCLPTLCNTFRSHFCRLFKMNGFYKQNQAIPLHLSLENLLEVMPWNNKFSKNMIYKYHFLSFITWKCFLTFI